MHYTYNKKHIFSFTGMIELYLIHHFTRFNAKILLLIVKSSIKVN